MRKMSIADYAASLVMADPLADRYDIAEMVREGLSQKGRPVVWYCMKYKTTNAIPVGDATCEADPKWRKGKNRHRTSTFGCGWHVLYPLEETREDLT